MKHQLHVGFDPFLDLAHGDIAREVLAEDLVLVEAIQEFGMPWDVGALHGAAEGHADFKGPPLAHAASLAGPLIAPFRMDKVRHAPLCDLVRPEILRYRAGGFRDHGILELAEIGIPAVRETRRCPRWSRPPPLCARRVAAAHSGNSTAWSEEISCVRPSRSKGIELLWHAME